MRWKSGEWPVEVAFDPVLVQDSAPVTAQLAAIIIIR
jgi:hypothetical protein